MKLTSSHLRIFTTTLCIVLLTTFPNHVSGFYKCIDPDDGSITFTNMACPSSKTASAPEEDNLFSNLSLEPIVRSNEDVEDLIQRIITTEQNTFSHEDDVIYNGSPLAPEEKPIGLTPQETSNNTVSSKKTVVKSKKSQSHPYYVILGGKKFPVKYNTTLHKGMSLYRDAADVKDDFSKLDDIIASVDQVIKNKAPRNKSQVLRLLRSIAAVLDQKDYTFNNYVLKPKNCRYSLIYTAIGEALDLPIKAIVTPGHILVRFILPDNTYYNWEHKYKYIARNEGFINRENEDGKNYKIHQRALKNGVYLRTLSDTEVLGICYNQLGISYKRQGDFSQAIAEYTEAIRLAPKTPWLYGNRAYAYNYTNRFEQAIADANIALRLDPLYVPAYNAMGASWFYLLDPEKSLQNYRAALQIVPDNKYAIKGFNRAQSFLGKKYYVQGVHELVSAKQ